MNFNRIINRFRLKSRIMPKSKGNFFVVQKSKFKGLWWKTIEVGGKREFATVQDAVDAINEAGRKLVKELNRFAKAGGFARS